MAANEIFEVNHCVVEDGPEGVVTWVVGARRDGPKLALVLVDLLARREERVHAGRHQGDPPPVGQLEDSLMHFESVEYRGVTCPARKV